MLVGLNLLCTNCCRGNLVPPSEVYTWLLLFVFALTFEPNRVLSCRRQTHLGVLTQTMPMWQKKIHSLSFWFSHEQRFSRRWAVWVSCARGPSSTVGLVTETVEAGEHKRKRVSHNVCFQISCRHTSPKQIYLDGQIELQGRGRMCILICKGTLGQDLEEMGVRGVICLSLGVPEVKKFENHQKTFHRRR